MSTILLSQQIDSFKIEFNLCGTHRGSIEIFVSGGVPPYTFIWTGPNDFYATTQNIYDLYAGIYILTGFDSEQTPFVDPNNGLYIINDKGIPPPPIDISWYGEYNVSCHGGCDGWIRAGDYLKYHFASSYRWTCINDGCFESRDEMDLINLCAGVYFLELWDTAGCYYKESIELTEPPPPIYYDTIKVYDTTFVYDTIFIEVFDTIFMNDTVTETIYKVVYNYIDSVINTEILDTINYVSVPSTSESTLLITNHNTELCATEAWEWANIYDLKGDLLKTTLKADRVSIADLETGIYLFIGQTKTGFNLRFKFFKY